MAHSYVPTWTYKRFGKFLLSTYDLDPLYVILASAGMDEKALLRWLLGYWVFYSAGPSSYLSEITSPKAYYDAMFQGDLDRWPRGHERRHMRGQAFIDTLEGLKSFGSPEKVAYAMIKGNDFQTISNNAQKFTGFGPWISWKIADMTERVLCKSVDFSSANLYMYKDPVKGAALLKYNDQHHKMTPDDVQEVVDLLLDTFFNYTAPPYDDRPLNIQEIETILCKYKSYINGAYPPGLDTHEIYEGLDEWGYVADCLKIYLKPWVQALDVRLGGEK